MKITPVKKSEYASVMRFLENVYGFSRNQFALTFPQIWREETFDADNTLAIREKGKIVSFLRIFPLRFMLGRATLYAGGIGAVATDPECRGKGFMSILMQEAIRKMKEYGYAVSILGGDRHRYGNFGYENHGHCISVTVEARGLTKTGITLPSVKQYFGEDAVLSRIMDAYNSHPCRAERTKKFFQSAYEKNGIAIYYAGSSRTFGYLAATSWGVPGGISEFGGNPCTVLGIAAYLNRRFEMHSFTLTYPDFSSVPDIIVKSACSWTTAPAGMLKILNLKKTIEEYAEEIGPLFPEGISLTLSTAEQTVGMEKKNGVFRIINNEIGPSIILDERALVRLLFGLPSSLPSGISPETKALLKSIFPLPFLYWPLDRI